MTPDTPTAPIGDPLATLERAFIDEFLRRRGHTQASVQGLQATERDALLTAASVYASGRLTEVESRAHLLDDLDRGHGGENG